MTIKGLINFGFNWDIICSGKKSEIDCASSTFDDVTTSVVCSTLEKSGENFGADHWDVDSIVGDWFWGTRVVRWSFNGGGQ